MSKRTPPKMISGGDNPYDIHDAKLSSSATAHESSSVAAHEISNTQGGLFIARFDKKSKPDFEGVLNNGQAIIFDVKSTEQDKIRASALSKSQATYLERYHSMGAVSFILVCLQFKDFYMVPWETWKDMKVLCGHLHMTRNELEPYRVSTANGYIHFLEHIAEEG